MLITRAPRSTVLRSRVSSSPGHTVGPTVAVTMTRSACSATSKPYGVLIEKPADVLTGPSSTATTWNSQPGTPSALRSTPNPSHATPNSNGLTPGTITAAT